MRNKDKNTAYFDFAWVFNGEAEQDEDDQKYKTFLKDMYNSGTNSFLILNKEEEEFLINYKNYKD